MSARASRVASVGFLGALVALAFVSRVGRASHAERRSAAAVEAKTPVAATETAVFAGGCFWGIQAVFQHVKGVVTATSGYSGGWTDRPSYEQVSSGRTGHAESVRVIFDPSQVSYAKLLEVFFSVAHDPTQLNRQGPDVGTQYRSALFVTSPEQKRAAESYIAQLNDSKAFRLPIATQVQAFKDFYIAEPHHQDYARRNPREPYIVMYDAPKVANLKRRFPTLYTDQVAGYE